MSIIGIADANTWAAAVMAAAGLQVRGRITEARLYARTATRSTGFQIYKVVTESHDWQYAQAL